jgi:hypothetical protein
MKQTIWNHRRNLCSTLRKLEEGKLTIGFIGGSITDSRPRHNWPEPVIAWFVETFPKSRIVVENAAIGATGSDLAVFRAQRDLIDRGCNLIFIDYAVNDKDEPSEKRFRTREGLVRKLLAGEDRDLIFVYTYSQDMFQVMMSGGIPDSIREFEELAGYYGIGSVWMGLYALEEVKKGRMRWEEWLPDGLHPTSRGSMSYGQSVIAFLKKEMKRAYETKWDDVRAAAMAKPLNPHNWEATSHIPFDEIHTEGPWTIRRWPYYEWIDQVLETAAVGAKLSFEFHGRGLALGFDFGKTSAEFRYRIDGGEWKTEELERPDWVSDEGWYRLCFLGDELDMGRHEFELEVIHGNRPECKGTNFRLAKVGIIR